jgi:hypothetical protein
MWEGDLGGFEALLVGDVLFGCEGEPDGVGIVWGIVLVLVISSGEETLLAA